MSCVGKTTFAKTIEHPYICFDALFPWYDIELFGLSTSGSLKLVRDACKGNKFVLDGWHLSDPSGKYLPAGATVYCLFADYDFIVNQYRIPVCEYDEFRMMFHRWYNKSCEFLDVRYWKNTGTIDEVSKDDFFIWLDNNR